MADYFILVIAVLIGIIIFFALQRKNGPVIQPKKMNYKVLFLLGACFLPAGVAISLSQDNFAYNGLSAIGLIYMIVGLANRDKWE